MYVKGCSFIDLIRLGQYAVYINLEEEESSMGGLAFLWGSWSRVSRDHRRASARDKNIHTIR